MTIQKEYERAFQQNKEQEMTIHKNIENENRWPLNKRHKMKLTIKINSGTSKKS